MIRRLIDWRRRRRQRHAAYERLVETLEDPRALPPHSSGWADADAARAAIYERAQGHVQDAPEPLRRLYGTRAQRRAGWEETPRTGVRPGMLVAVGIGLLIIAAGISSGIRLLDGTSHPSAPRQLASGDYVTRVGEIRTIQLSDGSRITLDTNAELRVRYTRAVRSILLDRGRVRFEVAHDAAWPFVVTAGGGTVTARGTVFDVDAASLVHVALIEGAIDVQLPSPKTTPLPVRHLHAGEQLVFDPTMAGAPERSRPDASINKDWVSGMKTFDDVPLSDILAELNRYSVTRIELADPSLGTGRRFFDLDLRDINGSAEDIAGKLHLEIDRSRPGLLLLRAPKDRAQ